MKLTPEDRSAINLLLGETAAAEHSSSQTRGQSQSHAFAAASGADHVQAVRTLLQLLAVLPAPEPSADLVARTMTHVRQATGQLLDSPARQSGQDHHGQRPA